MATSTDLRVKISADLQEIKAGLGLLKGELAKVKDQSAKAMSGSSTRGLVDGLKRARAELAGLVGAYASLAGARMLAGMADEAKLLRGRIREAKGDYAAILQLAQETRSGMGATVDLYARLERSTRGQIQNQSELLGLTRTVNQAIKLSYAGTAQGEAAILQLGQALSSGRLQGDEFRSISENTPRLMQAIADGMNVPLSKMKELAKQGKLTTEEIIAALRKQSGVLAEEYARVPVTIGDALTQIRNSFVDFIGKADEANGASARFASALQGVAANLPRLLEPVLVTVTAIIEHFDVLAVYIGTRLVAAAIPAAITAVGKLRTAFVALRTATLAWSASMAALGGPIGIALAALAAGIYLVYTRTNDAKRAAKEHEQALADNAKMAEVSAEAALKDAQAKRLQAAETLRAARAALEEQRARFRTENQSVTARGGDRGDAAALASTNALNRQRAATEQAEKEYKDWGDRLAKMAVDMAIPLEAPMVALGKTADATAKAGKKAKEAVRGVADAAELARDATERSLKALEQRYTDGLIPIQDYFQQREALETQLLDQRIVQAKHDAATATSTDQQSRAITEIIKLQRERAEIAPRVAREQAAAEKEATQATLDKMQADMDAITGNVRSQTEYVNALAQLGNGALDSEDRLKRIRGEAIQQLIDLRARREAYIATLAPGSPQMQAAQLGLRALGTEIAQLQAQQNKFGLAMKDQAFQSLNGFLNDLTTRAKSFKEAFADMVQGFIQGVQRMLMEVLARKGVEKLIGWIGGWFGGGGAGQFHSGGIVGQGGARRASPFHPALWGLAPRFHAGGFPGLRADEVAAVLQRGEEVITRRDPRHAANGGGMGGNTYVEVHNYGSEPAKVTESGNGMDRIIKVVIGAVAGDVAQNGQVGKAIGTRFGVSPVGVLRG